MVERRMLAYVTLLSGNLEATREFLAEYRDQLPFPFPFMVHLEHLMKSLESGCTSSGERLIARLSGLNLKEEVFDETH